MSGDDFNALFIPMKGRGGIIQFDKGESALDAKAQTLVDQVFADQRGDLPSYSAGQSIFV